MDNLQLNTGLIEAFGELERLCNQIYGTQHDVTSYIDEMRSFGVHGSYRIANWNDNLSRLIAIRHKRNKLSHGEISFQSVWANEQDVLFARRFKEMILRQEDPLAQFHRLTHPRPTVQSHPTNSPAPHPNHYAPTYRLPQQPAYKQPIGCAVSALCLACFIAALFVFLLTTIL